LRCFVEKHLQESDQNNQSLRVENGNETHDLLKKHEYNIKIHIERQWKVKKLY
jgi:hypothetical protein